MRKFISFLFVASFCSVLLFAQEKIEKRRVYTVAFYNLENLFDTINDPNKNDEEFLPSGGYRWNSQKYVNKLRNMARVLDDMIDTTEYRAIGPAVIGVSEIENKQVLLDLVQTGNFSRRGYKVIHYDSPDRRGVDVGMLYNPKLFVPIQTSSHRLITPDTNFITRDQLLVTGMMDGEVFHFVVNHWPSRLGGEKRSRPKRNAAAALSRHLLDSVMLAYPGSKGIIMGDLNDDPYNESCAKIVGAKKKISDVRPGDYFNPFWTMLDKGNGTLLYQGNWNLFDQHLLSSNLVESDLSSFQFWKSEIFRRDYMVVQEGKYRGSPKRTHGGGAWLNGFSDHFPTMIYLWKEVKE